MSELEATYESAFESALIVQHDLPGVIELRGADRLDLLHRLSTNDLESMPAKHVERTVFTDPVGRMIDIVTVLNLSDELLIVTSSGRSQAMQDWLQRHIFFQDDVAVKVADIGWSLYGAYGPKAADSLPSAAPDAKALIASDQGIVWHVDRPVPGFLNLIGPDHTAENWVADSSAADAFERRWAQRSAKTPFPSKLVFGRR
jgi:folate-binding Fe-S cluster repair protein YgfZ